MDSQQLTYLLQTCDVTRLYFAGVYALDNLPAFAHPPFCLILNSSPLRSVGAHWYAISVSETNQGTINVEFFDSLGNPAYSTPITNF